jgi:hypothetical protein
MLILPLFAWIFTDWEVTMQQFEVYVMVTAAITTVLAVVLLGMNWGRDKFRFGLKFASDHTTYFVIETIVISMGAAAISVVPVLMRARKPRTGLAKVIEDHPLTVLAKFTVITIILHFSGLYEIGTDVRSLSI